MAINGRQLEGYGKWDMMSLFSDWLLAGKE